MSLYIYSWNPASEGAALLKEALGIRKIRHQGSTFKGSTKHTVINWGSSEVPPEVLKSNVINHPDNVNVTSNKLSFFRKISQSNRDLLPPWTTDINTAIEWTAAGHTVCARTVLNGHSGNGLILMDRDNPKSFVRAPLYTQYVKKQEEYRVHVVNGNIIAIQRKVLRREKAESGDEINWKVRNLDNGFIYQREGINPPEEVRVCALEAVRLSELDFAASDIIYNQRERRAYCLELNSAPGIQGSTVEDYAEAFRRFLN